MRREARLDGLSDGAKVRTAQTKTVTAQYRDAVGNVLQLTATLMLDAIVSSRRTSDGPNASSRSWSSSSCPSPRSRWASRSG